MKSWILVHAELGRCFDYVEKEGNDILFPVAEPLTWVDVTALAEKPQHGSSAAFENDEWVFSNQQQTGE